MRENIKQRGTESDYLKMLARDQEVLIRETPPELIAQRLSEWKDKLRLLK